MSSRKVPALELSTLSMPGGIDDPDDPYTDFSDLSAASPAGCYPEIIVSSDFQDDPGSARSTSELIPQDLRSSPRPPSPYLNSRPTPPSPSPSRAASTRGSYRRTKDSTGVWHTTQTTPGVVNTPPPPPPAFGHPITINSPRPPPVEMIKDEHPTVTPCFNCKKEVVSYIYYRAGACTWLSCVGLSLIGCIFGCCLLPFWSDKFKDCIHKCPHCHVMLGKHKKLGC